MPASQSRAGGLRLRTLPAALLLGLAAACTTPPQPPPPPPPPAPAQPTHTARVVLHAVWSFREAPEGCLAQARAGQVSLELAVHPDGPIRLSLWLTDDAPARPLALFNGVAGSWRASGTAYHREAVFLLPRSDSSLGRLLILLSGGVLDVAPQEQGTPLLSLPQSGADGQHWFACARHSVTGT